MAYSEGAVASSPLQSYLGLLPVQVDHSLAGSHGSNVAHRQLVFWGLPQPVAAIVGFVGCTTVTGGGEFSFGGLLGGVVVTVSDFLFLVVWSVHCARYASNSLSGVSTLLDIQFLVVVHVH